jgi:hypothetical protein
MPKFVYFFISILLFCGCENIPLLKENPEEKKLLEPLIISTKEKELLSFIECDKVLDIDTIQGHQELLDEFYKKHYHERDKSCVKFTFTQNDTSYNDKFIISFSKPMITLGGAIRNVKKILYISVEDSTTIGSYGGGYVSGTDKEVEKMNGVIYKFFTKAKEIEKEEGNDKKNSISYQPITINISFYPNGKKDYNRVLSEILKGYILFQRDNSLSLFNNHIDSLSTDQLKLLINDIPLYVNIKNEKINTVRRK